MSHIQGRSEIKLLIIIIIRDTREPARDESTTCVIALLCNDHVGKWTGSTDTISEKDQPWTFLFKFHRILSSDLKKKEDKVAILNVEQCHWT